MTQLGDGEVASCSSAVSTAEKICGVKLKEYGYNFDLYILKNILEINNDDNDKNDNKNINYKERTSSILNFNNINNNNNNNSNNSNTKLNDISNKQYHKQYNQQNNIIVQNVYQSTQNLNNNNNCNNGNINCNGIYSPGMKDVGTWLKTLRLHKYTTMFQDLSYDEMMNLDDKKLEARKVTKGARKKILQSLEKLKERVPSLREHEKNMDEKYDLSTVIGELRSMMNTPIKPYNEKYSSEIKNIVDIDYDDLPGHIIFICSRLQSQLYIYHRINDLEGDYVLKLLQIYEKICGNESFTEIQKQHSGSWKKIVRRTAVEKNLLPGNNQHGYVNYSSYNNNRRSSRIISSRSSTTSPPESSCAMSPPPMPQSNSAPPHVSNQIKNSYIEYDLKKSLNEKSSISKSRSSPDNSNLIPKPNQQLLQYMNDNDIQHFDLMQKKLDFNDTKYYQKHKRRMMQHQQQIQQQMIENEKNSKKLNFCHIDTPHMGTTTGYTNLSSMSNYYPEYNYTFGTQQQQLQQQKHQDMSVIQNYMNNSLHTPIQQHHNKPRNYQNYNGRQSDPSPRTQSNLSGYYSDRLSGAGSPTSQYRPLHEMHYSFNTMHVK